MRSSLALAFSAAAVVCAQSVPKYDSALNMTIEPSSVDAPLRAQWCNGHKPICTKLCNNNWKENECDYQTLEFDCICANNGSAPGLQYYKETMPFHICQTLFGQCITKHENDPVSQEACNNNIESKCPRLDPPKNAISGSDDSNESSTSASPSSTPAPDSEEGNGDEGNSEVTTTNSDGFAAPTLAPAANGVAAIAAIGILAYLV
jgi:hypothetical protein